MIVRLLLASIALAGASAFAQAPGPAIAIDLTPRLASGKVSHVDVKERISMPRLAAGGELVRMPIVYVSIPSSVEDPHGLQAADDLGPLPLGVKDDPVDPSGFAQWRHWHAARATKGDVVISYRAFPRTITPQTRPGPLIDVRSEGQGFHGSGTMLLALPEDGPARPVALRWHLSDLPAGSRGVSSLGQGDYRGSIELDKLRRSFFMAGPVISSPPDGSGSFAAYWLTPASFDLEGAVEQTRRFYRYAGRFWNDADKPFRIFMRTTDRFQGGGSGQHQSFIFGTVAGKQRDPEDVRGLMAHETMHNWISGMGAGGGGGQWYSEGATVYYTTLLSHRAGLIGLEDYQTAMNRLARSYYLNPRSNFSNDEVTQTFWSDGDAQVVPYQRGPLYFAKVDAEMRAASGGKRRLDELMKQMVSRSRKEKLTPETWISLVRGALGEAGVAGFHAMMAGKPLDLPSNLLGPCFRSQPTLYRRVQLGFRVEEGATESRIGRLDPKSPAALAGLRDGDVLLDPKRLEEVDDLPPGPLTVRVRRDASEVAITFEPGRREAEGLTWVRTQVPASLCSI